MENDAVPSSPNLDSLTQSQPTSKRALVRLLWPKIRASLDLGHSAREVRRKLQLDGIELSYPCLCRYIAEFRSSEPQAQEPEFAPQTMRRNNNSPAEGDAGRKRDPLDNVRRLTEERQPGFRYPGTMSEKELFGE